MNTMVAKYFDGRRDQFYWSDVKPGMAFLHDSTGNVKDAIYFVTVYDGDYIFEYRKFENLGMSQKFGIFLRDELRRLPEKDKTDV
jgi:hypothetical protein